MQKLLFHGRSLILLAGFLLVNGCGRQEEKPKQVPANTTNIGAAQTPIMSHDDHHDHVTLTMPAAAGHEPEIPDKLPDPEHPVMPTESRESIESQEPRGPDMGEPEEQVQESSIKEEKQEEKKPEAKIPETTNPNQSKSIDFEVENKTGKTIYVTCFSYVKRRDFSRWKWEKSDVYCIEDNAHAIIGLEKIDDEQDRKNVLGYLAVCNTAQEAQDTTYELLKEEQQIDLDEISKLHGKKVVITVEKYGMKGEFLEYDFIDKTDKKKASPSVDFPVENKTGKPLFVTCFIYEKKAKGRWLVAVEDKDDVAIWRYEKTNVVKIMPNEQKMIHVDTIMVKRDRDALEGYLAIFDEDEEQLAQDSIYELLESSRKLSLGLLYRLENKKVVLDIEKYGVSGDFIDFTIKPVSKIDFTKILK